MQIHSDYRNRVLYMRLSGEMDEHNAAQARRTADCLAENFSASERAVIDLSGVSFMDSTGIGFLIGRYKKFHRYGIPVYVTNPNLGTDKILQMSGVYTLMPKI
jgi:stage II sporulation protein AA (anti-sigma F factor antagonist)